MAPNNKKSNVENDDSVTLYVCKICCLKKPYNKSLINLDRLVITGKYQTSVFYVRLFTVFYVLSRPPIFSRNDRTLG